MLKENQQDSEWLADGGKKVGVKDGSMAHQ